MAEKYGTIPPKFTAAWFDYVWTYYRWHIIIPIVAIAFAALTLYQCTHKIPYDAEVLYAGHAVFSDKQEEEIQEGLAKYCSDVNGDGETLVFFQQINFSDKPGTEEMDYNMQTKLDLQLHADEIYLFLFDKYEADIMIDRDSTELVYVPVSDWADKMPEEDMLYTKDGVAYAVSLAGNQKIKDIGINTDDIYITVRINNKEDDKSAAVFENSIRMANALIGD